MDDLFARVRPLVGDELERCVVAIIGPQQSAVLVEYLVACGVRRWLVMADNRWMDALVTRLQGKYGSELDISVNVVNSLDQFAGASLAMVVNDGLSASQLPNRLPRLAIFTPTLERTGGCLLALPGEPLEVPESSDLSCAEGDWQMVAPIFALLARALLLQGTAYAMASWEEAWKRGIRAYYPGMPNDPTLASWSTARGVTEIALPCYRTPMRRSGTLMIVGLGSLGSVAAQQLAPWVDRLILVDCDQVEAVNLIRQGYSYGQIGMGKAAALAQSLSAAQPELKCVPVISMITQENQVAMLIRRYGVTAALVTTGSNADFAIARALRAASLPHVMGRCYARARYWEGIVVDGCAGASYEQLRREVGAGPVPMLTPEEIAAYGAIGTLAAEPATAMETGWAAMWLARLMVQLMTPEPLREGWMLARLAVGANCFIGGAVVERADGRSGDAGGVQGDIEAAYGVTVPGMIHAWSIGEVN